MGSRVKFYARFANMKNLVMSDRGVRIFDSDFWYGHIEDSTFDNAEINDCVMSYATFKNVSFVNGYFYRLITHTTRFMKCDFTEAYMDNFTFDGCMFTECDFSRCDMRNVTFKSCAFYDCDFKEVELPPFFYPIDMKDCVNVPYMPMACPEEGEFIGYKIASSEQFPAITSLIMPFENIGPANVLVTLKIPADARRSSAGGRKCRCDKAKVIGVPFFDENRWHECAAGIHFFINRKEALQYYGLL